MVRFLSCPAGSLTVALLVIAGCASKDEGNRKTFSRLVDSIRFPDSTQVAAR